MRTLGVASILIVVVIALGWLLGPSEPAPPLSQQLVGEDATWLERAAQFSARRRLLAIASLVLTPLLWWLLIRLGWSTALRAWLEQHITANPWLLVAGFTAVFVIGTDMLNLPLSYAGLTLRRSYGLSPETTPAWLIRHGKELLVALLLTLIMVEVLYWLLRSAPERWWLLAAGATVVGAVLLTYATPYVITPLFFTQQPLADQALRAQIMELGTRTGVPISEVYVIDASTQGNEGNAYFTGVGGATRVVVYDTLLRQYPTDELLTILAHELGHWRAQHVWKGLLLTAVGAPVGLWLVHLLLQRLLPAWGIRGPADIASLPLIMLLATLGSLATLPAQNWISRHWEREADRFALAATGDPAAFQATFVRLARQNLADPTPPRLYEGIFATHPAIGRRVADAQTAPGP